MRIIVRKSDSVVLFAEEDLVLTAGGLIGDGWTANFCTPEKATLVDVELPSPFAGGMYAYIDGQFSIADQAMYDAAVKASVPKKIDRLQARLTLLSANKWSLIQPVIDAIADQDTKDKAQAYFEDATYWYRNDEFVLMLAPQIGYDDASLDAAFIAASKIQPPP